MSTRPGADPTGVRLYGDRIELAGLLELGGGQDVVRVLERPVPQMRNALTAIAGTYEWVTVDDLAVALGCTRVGARVKVHHWPPTELALHAWLPSLPGWSVRLVDGVWRAVPLGPAPALNRRDTGLLDAARRRQQPLRVAGRADQHRLPPEHGAG